MSHRPMRGDQESKRSSALVPGIGVWPSEWSTLNRLLLTIPKDVPLLRYLRVRPLDSRHWEGLKVLHQRLFPISYDTQFYYASCGIKSPAQYDKRSLWSACDVIGIGLFLPREVVTTHCDCDGLICCESDESSPNSGVAVVSDNTNQCDSSGSDNSSSDCTLNVNVNVALDDAFIQPPEVTNAANKNNCIFNDATYDRSREEFLVGFLTILLNRTEQSRLIYGEDYLWLDAFFNDMIYPLVQECGDHDDRMNRFLNYDMMTPDFYHFLYKNLYLNRAMIDSLRHHDIKKCKTVYILSAGITMGLRSRLLGTYLILYLECLVYQQAYGVHIYNRNMYFFPEESREETVGRIKQHILSESSSSITKEQEKEIKRELDPYLLTKESIMNSYRQQDEMPLTIYLHTIAYNRKACSMYRRTNFVCITRYDDYYIIRHDKYAANLLAYYAYAPC
ncbi:hypothetical protein BgAZ_209560 [Babesia gibsoni]|uniref:histone acetyltransferase n=1 Tax=Babesia gibsoni TaxID=33632 RepID=A0AAD8PEY2_BABGI|nr:hypothetical protein BgAZ_209560 [Babesia gibsoni]